MRSTKPCAAVCVGGRTEGNERIIDKQKLFWGLNHFDVVWQIVLFWCLGFLWFTRMRGLLLKLPNKTVEENAPSLVIHQCHAAYKSVPD